MPESYRLCGIIPCYNNHATIRAVAETLRAQIEDVFIINDGSDARTTELIRELGEEGFHVVERAQNGGKGAAVKSGFAAARERGFTHGFQVDADGQHDLTQIPSFIARSKEQPEALLLAHPVFDASVPLIRLAARQITVFWVHVETFGPKIVDPMCGFRVYPLAAAIGADAAGDHMEFDIEIAVRMLRGGVPVVNLPVQVRYLDADEGGLSNFRMWGDNLAITRTHIWLVLGLIPWLFLPKRRLLEP